MELESWSRGSRRSGPHVLLTGGVHGDEFEPMVALRRLIAELGSSDLRGQVTIVPVVNEAAFVAGQRTAEDGLDLARTCPGRPGGTITEQVAAALSTLIRSADFYVDLHSGGTRLQVYPLAGYVLHSESDILLTQRRMARAFGPPLIWGTDPSLQGRSLSVARDAGVPAIYAEYLGGGGCAESGVRAYLQGCRNLLIDLEIMPGEMSRPPRAPVVVEDPRPNSGHMQIQNASPVDGYFEPCVRLGDRVTAGQTLGEVTDVLGSCRENIRATRSGWVIVLRTFPRVVRGESVGVVLETSQDLWPIDIGVS